MLRQLTSSELSELIAYGRLHPISPGLERMLARVAHMTAIGGSVQVNEEPIPLREHFISPFPEEP